MSNKYTAEYVSMILSTTDPLKIYETFVPDNKFSFERFQGYVEAAQQIVNTYFMQTSDNFTPNSASDKDMALASEIIEQTKILKTLSPEETKSFVINFLTELRENKNKDNGE